MSEIIGTITDVIDDNYQGKDFKVVTIGEGETLKVKQGRGGALKAKWGLLKVGTAIKFTMEDYTTPAGVKIPFVADIATVESGLGPPTKPEILPEHQDVITKARTSTVDPTRLSIEKQTAIKAAASIAVAKIMMGGDMSTVKVINVAKAFEMYLQGIEFTEP